MSALHLLIPAALVPADFAPDVLRGLSLPNLALVAAHGIEADSGAPDALLAPWQSWAVRHMPGADLAALWAAGLQDRPADAAPDRSIWLAEPVHFQIARDHLVLADPADLEISAQEALDLASAIQPLLDEAGWTLHTATPARWLLTRPDQPGLRAASAARAIGRNVEPWLPLDEPPGGGAALAWRRLSNDIQMTWYAHPLNDAREARRRAPVNALWLTGAGQSMAPAALPYRTVRSTIALLRELPLNADAGAVLETCDTLMAPARAQDWSDWRNGVQGLDLRVGELIAGLRAGTLHSLTLALAGDERVRALTVRRGDLWKFWRRGHAVELFADIHADLAGDAA